MMNLVRLRGWVGNERGAEIAEWVLWAGSLAVLASTIYLAVATQFPSTVANIMSGISSAGS
jgi:hypothetical protein